VYILEGTQHITTKTTSSPAQHHSSPTNYSCSADYTLWSTCMLPSSFEHTSTLVGWGVMWEHPTYPETALSTQQLSLLLLLNIVLLPLHQMATCTRVKLQENVICYVTNKSNSSHSPDDSYKLLSPNQSQSRQSTGNKGIKASLPRL
jgi:hypothetical protein